METGLIIRNATAIVNSAAWNMFAQQCDIPYPGTFCSDLIRIFAPNRKAAKHLYREKREKLASTCRNWGQSFVELFWSMNERPLQISADSLTHNNETGVYFTMNQPLITVPTIEVGSLTLTRQLLNKIGWMIENPKEVTGITRIHDEAQVIMSASSVALLTTTTLQQAVKRRRHEYWHPGDLINFRVKTGELIRDLKNGIINPEETREEVSWRCVSGSGRWRLITHEYQTFVDDAGVAYQLSRNLGVEAIDRPSDLILV